MIDDRYVFRLTDDTGMLQHAVSGVPDPTEGYTLDDNARALIMADLVGLRWRSRRGTHGRDTDGPFLRLFYSGSWAGVGIGLATAVKLTPALFIAYLLITRQWRVAATAVGTTIGVTLGTVRQVAKVVSFPRIFQGVVVFVLDEVGHHRGSEVNGDGNGRVCQIP